MKRFIEQLKNDLNENKGVFSIEYVIILVLIVLVLLAAFSALGGALANSISNTSGTIESATSCALRGGVWNSVAGACQ